MCECIKLLYILIICTCVVHVPVRVMLLPGTCICMYMYRHYMYRTGGVYTYPGTPIFIYFLMRCEVRTFLRDVSYCYSYYCYMLLNTGVPVDVLVYNMWYPCTHMYVHVCGTCSTVCHVCVPPGYPPSFSF